jgi:TetR/AcrR family transcriptional regulator, transcriptional repressor for nem operon
MRVSREQAAQNRERILKVAARLFRERGVEGIGVADLMKSAGLTHGGFYGHFESKEDLVAQACERAIAVSEKRWQTLAESGKQQALDDLINHYLSTQHRDSPGTGCLFAALGPETARQGFAVRRAVSAGLNRSFELLGRLMGGRTQKARRREAIATYAALVGGLILSRAATGPELSEEILEAVKESL